MLREGVQEAEAKVFIEAALLDKHKRATLGEEATQAHHETLKGRIRAILRAHPGRYKDIEPKNWQWYATGYGIPDGHACRWSRHSRRVPWLSPAANSSARSCPARAAVKSAMLAAPIMTYSAGVSVMEPPTSEVKRRTPSLLAVIVRPPPAMPATVYAAPRLRSTTRCSVLPFGPS